MKVRTRLTLDAGVWARALVYAEDTHRTPAELVEEALEQIMARYPKRRQCVETDLDVLCTKIASRLGLRVPAGTLYANPDSESSQ